MPNVIVPVVGGSNIEGNIGSCKVVSTEAQFDYWHKVTILTNSCNGTVVAQNIYLDQAAINNLAYGFGSFLTVIIVIAFGWYVFKL